MAIPASLGVSAAGLPPLGDQASAVISNVFTAVGPGDPFAFRGPFDIAVYGSVATTLTTTNGSSAATVASGTGIAAGGAINSVNVPKGTTWKTFSGTAGTLALPAAFLPASNLSTSSPFITLPPGSNVAALLGATVTVPSSAEGVALPANTTVFAIAQLDIPATPTSPGQPGIVQLSAAPTAVPADPQPRPLRFALTTSAVSTGADANAVFTGVAATYSGTVQVELSYDGAATWIPMSLGPNSTTVQFTGVPIVFTLGEAERQVLYRLNCIAYTSGTINYRVSQNAGATESLAIGPLVGG